MRKASFKQFYKYTALFLSIILVFNMIGVSVANAQSKLNTEAEKQQKSEVANIGEIPNKLPKEKLELTNKRTKYSSRYLNPDGSFTEEIFLEPQFYQDPSDKKWKKIDNKLKAKDKDKKKYENTANDVKTTFANESGNNELVSVEKKGKSISLIPVNAKKAKGKLKDNEITYEGIYDNVDIRYQLNGNAVKEDIILHNTPVENTFTFELKLKGLKAETNENGMILFTDNKGVEQFYLEKPYMTDANGKYSDDVTLTLREEKGKTYVDVIADSAFLEDPETQYPVTIDPTINDWNVIRDLFIASNFPDSVYPSETFLTTGYHGYFGATRSLVEFVLPALPSDSSIQNASFFAYQVKNDSSTATIDLERITSDWDSSNTTWNSQPSLGGVEEFTASTNTVNEYWEWEITQLTKDWYNGVQENFGFMLIQWGEEVQSPYRTFNSVNSGNMTPRISINYTVDPIGYEDFWSTTEDGVNPANGNLVLPAIDVSIPGQGLNVDVTRTYNSRKSWHKGMFGYGWWSNTEALIVDSGEGPITLIDGDNTRHIFGQQIGGGYITPGGLYVDLEKNQDGTYTITNADGTKTSFNTNGKISSIVDPNGNTISYVYDAADKLTSIQDNAGRVTTYAYHTNGLVSSITDPANRITTYEYDAADNLIEVIDPAGIATIMTYVADHNLKTVTDGRNITTTINYDESDRVEDINRPITINGAAETSTTTFAYDTANTVTTVIDGEGNRVDYTYNANGNIVQISRNPLDAQNKSVTTFFYDDNNNLTKVVDPKANRAGTGEAYVYTYDANGNITSVQLPEGETAAYTYDQQNNLIEENNFNNNVSEFDYDSNNNQLESFDPYQQSVAQRYDESGNLSYMTHPMSAANNLVPNSNLENDENNDNWPDQWQSLIETGKTATIQWENESFVGNKSISISDPTGWTVVQSEESSYNPNENYVVSGYIKTENITNEAKIKIDFYNSQNAWLGQTFSYGLKGTHDWTRMQAVIDDVPANTAYIRAGLDFGPGTGKAYFDGIQIEKGTILSAYNLVENSSFEKDTNGDHLPDNWETSNNLSVNDVLDTTESLTGNTSFRITGEIGNDKFIKQTISVSGDANTPFTLSGWSKQIDMDLSGSFYGIQIAIHNTDGTIDWTNAHDFDKKEEGWQHIAAEVTPSKSFTSVDVYYYYFDQIGTAWFDAMRLEMGASHTTFSYDNQGNQTSVSSPLGDSTSFQYDTVGNQTSVTNGLGKNMNFEYDARNLLTKVIDPNFNETLYGYDEVGNRTTVTDAKNQGTHYQYNEFNQVSSIINPLNQVTQFEYNRNGGQTKLTHPNGDSISYDYNALNQLNKIIYNGVEKWNFAYDANGYVTSETDDKGNTTTYNYDKNGSLIQKAKGSTNVIDYVYDQMRNKTSFTANVGTDQFTNQFEYNKLDQLTAMSLNNSEIVEFVYDERGNITSTIRSNGTYTAYEYDANNRLKSLRNYNANGEVLYQYGYTYDANGNWTGVSTNQGNISYQYDDLNRLVQETLLDGTNIEYQYDSVGNRTKKIVTNGSGESTTDYLYDAGNQLIDVNGQSYSYDQNGNLTNNGDQIYVYNENNRLIEVKDAGGTTVATFDYDSEGKRTTMTTSTGTVNFHYDGDQVIYETDENNIIVAEYTWDAQGNPVTMTKNGVTYHYHINGHGDVTSLTDSSGNIVASYEYDAWGNILSQSGALASENPYRYASYRYDEGTGLYYLMARYYDAEDSRFLTRDTFQGFEDNPLSLNQYSYVENNPIMYVDPSGHFAIPLAYAAVLAFLGAWLIYYAIKSLNAVGKLIDQSFARVKTKPRYRSKYEVHHIVAQKHWKAAPSRSILTKVGLSVNSSQNLVSIKTGMHRRTHYYLYYDTVNLIMKKVYNYKSSYSTNRKKVIAALGTIKVWLKAKSATSPF
ncbi:DNRLRE domain-containing protein [Chengkuizengella sediminis]|uniref:DNRLRE domain-containing protein n=1 Tax=Chengkuizengella sediminis TaxID=1885917 RepID=UPI001F1002D9|nr:DNRLRE domain-containing protein [Chengkuizengella sediminis]